MKQFRKILFLCIAVLPFLASCQKQDPYDAASKNGTLSVSAIYLEDYRSSVPDRKVEFCRLGQMIRIEGEGFLGLRHIYINGYDTYVNKAYVTDKSVLITVNRNTPVMDADESVRNTIRIVKDAAEITVPFIIRAASPSITDLDIYLPQPGQTVKAVGENLHEISKITFSDGTVVSSGIVSDEDGEWFTFTMPEVAASSDPGKTPFYAEGANGTAAAPYAFNFKGGIILNFDGVGGHGFWSWSETGSMIDDEHDIVNDPLGVFGRSMQLVPERILQAGGVGAGKSRVSECWTTGQGDEGCVDWEGLAALLGETTPVTDIAFQFDIYCPDAWDKTGQIEICMMNNYAFNGLGNEDSSNSDNRGLCGFFVPWVSGAAFQTSGWQTVTIPISEFKQYYYEINGDDPKTSTFADVVATVRAATYQNFGVGFTNADFTIGGVEYTSSPFNQRIYLDNWRFVPYGTEEISDYPED